MDFFNIPSELSKANSPAYKSGLLKLYAKGGFTGRSDYKRSIENDIRVGMYEPGGMQGDPPKSYMLPSRPRYLAPSAREIAGRNTQESTRIVRPQFTADDLSQIQQKEEQRKNLAAIRSMQPATEAMQRKLRIEDANKAQEESLTSSDNWQQLLARQTQATGDKLDVPFIPNWIDPFYMIGSMASNLGAAPYNIQQGNYGEAAWSVAAPVLTGALAGIGAKSTGQFANNLFNPLAGAKLPSKNNVAAGATSTTRNLSREDLIQNLRQRIDKTALANDYRNIVANPLVPNSHLTYPELTISENMRLQRELYNRNFNNLNSRLSPLSKEELTRYLSSKDNSLNQLRPTPSEIRISPEGRVDEIYPPEYFTPEYSVWPRPKSVVNRSGLTKDEVLASSTVKDKNALYNLSEDEFEKTVLKPSGELVPYTPGTELPKMSYNMDTRNLQLDDVIPMNVDDYVVEFNSNIGTLNDIIAKRNKSGLEYKVKELKAFNGTGGMGRIYFENPAQTLLDADRTFHIPEGGTYWGINLNPGKWTGAVEDIPNAEYFKSIPGIEMSNTTAGVFADSIPRKGTGAYEAINEYLKTLNLGRVKPGFNSQTKYSRGAWENFVNSDRAHGFYGSPGTVYGAMKTLMPIGTALGVGAAATQEYEKGGLQLFGKGGYRVVRTSERKGKTHKVIGPGGKVKYFGDPSMGERSKSKYGKEAFYKRHAKNLKANPYFRAYARATWSDGGVVRDVEPFNLSSY